MRLADLTDKEPLPTPLCFSDQLLLVDQDLIHVSGEQINDLYFQLVKEPSFIKQDSLKYDYLPSPALLCPQENVPKNEQLENSSSLANQPISGVKCNCSKTKCQKNYCECFKAGLSCGVDCQCTDCSNDELFRTTLPKKISGEGCKCQKSHCLKNYCECHSGGRKCGDSCKCVECKNLEKEEEEIQSFKKPSKKVKREKSSFVFDIKFNANKRVV